MKINNVKELEALIGTTYMYAVVVAIVALVLAFIIASIIKYQGGKTDRSFEKRRLWFIIIGIIAPIGFFLYNMLVVNPNITKAPLQADFQKANLIATIGILVGYLLLGFVTMFIFRKAKWGSILGKTK